MAKKHDDDRRAAALIGDDEVPSGNNSTTVAAAQLKAFIERVERLDEEKKVIRDDRREVLAEAKAAGFDTKAITTIIKLRKQDAAEREEQEAILDLYKSALGMS